MSPLIWLSRVFQRASLTGILALLAGSPGTFTSSVLGFQPCTPIPSYFRLVWFGLVLDTHSVFLGARNRIWFLMHSQQAIYQPTYLSNPEIQFLKQKFKLMKTENVLQD